MNGHNKGVLFVTIFFFTATGNSLAVAKRICGTDGKLVSIPQIIDTPYLHYKDDVIGVVFPIYNLGLPKMVKRFLNKAQWEVDYAFIIGTYGCMPGATMLDIQKMVRKRGLRLDCCVGILMVDNFLPGFEMNDQRSRIKRKRIDENLESIISFIKNREAVEVIATFGDHVMTIMMNVLRKIPLSSKQGQGFIINRNCVKCGVCSQICPAGNIIVTYNVIFGDKCENCLGCVHICPNNAIHIVFERSAARWRNPDVSLDELIAANNRQQFSD